MKYNDNLLKNQTVFDLDSHKLSIGGQYRYEDLHNQDNQLPTATNVNKLTRWSWALFTEDEWTITTNDFRLTGWY
ncbi:TonB-dependent receptor [Arsenophonus endosymbiont of Bemisia tabaci]|uniref:TonB-dependent receptor n=1 Tax=Arsenophonus endosymbiont of Bemisia tabaci TaxID=536059 RepID=UPI002102E571|nr:TonB-dependent receptor [Arsenophonus endosymbiont of Bemisia tabaci]